MCLFVKEGCKPEIATKDIVCYKIVYDSKKYWIPYIYHAEYSYPYNKVLTAESYSKGEIHPIQHLEMKWNSIIEEGFHARYNIKSSIMKLCIIPKGTEYCLGKDNDIVAVNMIVFNTYMNYIWYRLKKLIYSIF